MPKWSVADDPSIQNDIQTMKEFSDDNLKFDENGRKLSKWIENTVGGEITHYELFLLLSRCFQKTCNCKHVKTRACLGKL